jgi:hypothetical protein
MSNKTGQLLRLVIMPIFLLSVFALLLFQDYLIPGGEESSWLTGDLIKTVKDDHLFENRFAKVKIGSLHGHSSEDMGCDRRCMIMILDGAHLSIKKAGQYMDDIEVNQPVVFSGREAISSITNNSAQSVRYVIAESLLTPFSSDPPGPDGYHARNDSRYQHGNGPLADFIYKDDYFRVYRLTPLPGSDIEMNYRLNGIFISNQTVREITYEFEDGKSISIDGEENNIWWVTAGKYAIASNYDTADLLYIEYLPVMRYDGYEP